MPHFDFRTALSPSRDPLNPSTPPIGMDPAGLTETDPRGNESHRQRQERLLAESDWTSLLFAMLVFSGGLFCAFYFFNGTELLRTVKALPHELLYPRPSTETQGTQNAKIDIFHRGSEPGSRRAGNFAESSDRRMSGSGPSIGSSRLIPSSRLATPGVGGGPSSTSFSPSSNSSSGSSALRSGSAASSRTTTQATNVAQAKASNVKRTAIHSPRRVRVPVKTAKQGLSKTKANAARLTQNVQRASRQTDLTRNNTARSTTNSGAGNLGRTGLGGLGHTGGAGGLGGRLGAGAASGNLSGGRH